MQSTPSKLQRWSDYDDETPVDDDHHSARTNLKQGSPISRESETSPSEENTVWGHDGFEQLQREEKRRYDRNSPRGSKNTRGHSNNFNGRRGGHQNQRSRGLDKPKQIADDKSNIIESKPQAKQVQRERKAPAIPDQRLYTVPKGKYSTQLKQQETAQKEENSLVLTLDIEVKEGRTEALVVHEGDDPISLAQAFCSKYQLRESFIDYIADLIKKHLSAITKA